jgi:hypothetical protein
LLSLCLVQRSHDDKTLTAVSTDDPNYGITLNFELLEDSFIIMDADGDNLSLNSISTISSDGEMSMVGNNGVTGVRKIDD